MGDPSQPPRILLYASVFEDGGVERIVVNLARGLDTLGWRVSCALRVSPENPYLPQFPETVGLHVLSSKRPRIARRELHALLGTLEPSHLLGFRSRDYALLVRAARASRGNPRVFLHAGVRIGQKLQGHRRGALRSRLYLRAARRDWTRAHGILSVGEGVTRDWQHHLGGGSLPIRTLPQPVVPEAEVERLGAEDPGHPWLRSGGAPVVLGVGRLDTAKNFPLLVRAFARVRRQLDARLIILGKGSEESRVREEIDRLGLGEYTDLPGFVANPYAYLGRAAVFVLSSNAESFGCVVAEALAAGTPVVSTDCPTGPSEILGSGEFGRLVPVNDEAALAEAILQTLSVPRDAQRLRARGRQYGVLAASAAFSDAMGLPPGDR